MAQWVECLLHKYGDPSSNLQDPHKARHVARLQSQCSCTEMMGEATDACVPARLTHGVSNKKCCVEVEGED